MFHILKVCVKHWRLCPKCCADFDPVAFTKEAIGRLDCRFKRNVYVSTEEIKFLVRRARVYERPPGIFPWEQERRVETSLMDLDTLGKKESQESEKLRFNPWAVNLWC